MNSLGHILLWVLGGIISLPVLLILLFLCGKYLALGYFRAKQTMERKPNNQHTHHGKT